MKLIELHILQSFPVSCLNRDDLGSPKSAIFGGVQRSRISSQCLKRAAREFAQENFDAGFGASRTKDIIPMFVSGLTRHGVDEVEAAKHATSITEALVGLDSKDNTKASTLLFIAPSEVEAICAKVADLVKTCPAPEAAEEANGKKGKKKNSDFSGKIADFCKEATLHDGVDIALFGRMVASTPSLTLEGAAMFSHAISTHKADNDLDFFSAVDDKKDAGQDAGAGMIGTTEFTSAVYYRYVALNLDLLKQNLNKLDRDQRQKVVNALIRSVLLAVPSARKNSMNASTRPAYVLGVCKQGQPVQLINAYEEAIRPTKGILAESIAALEKHNTELKSTWAYANTAEVSIPASNITEFCKQLVAYVE